MPNLSFLATLPPYHIVAYGTLLGVQVHQTFIAGLVAYKTLPRPQFSALQKGLFPIYFALQSALPVALALTFPGDVVAGIRTGAGPAGLLENKNMVTALLPIGAMFIGAVLNTVYLGPKVTSIMTQRKHQETRDGKKSYDAGPHSPEMQRLNKEFGAAHGLSSLSNMVSFIATVAYGLFLGAKL